MYDVKVLAHSRSELSPASLITMQVTFPRFLLAEFNTHRALSRNAASSRAIPVKKRIGAATSDPFVPEEFGSNQSGMQADDVLTGTTADVARLAWLRARDHAVRCAQELSDLGVHKQLVNRLLEPFAWVTVIVSGTDWGNFYNLRCHADAQPEFRKIAFMMREAHKASTPAWVRPGEWHLPMLSETDLIELRDQPFNRALVSAARCARVSYLTHGGNRSIEADLDLAQRLLNSGHMSPFEHPAQAMEHNDESNFNHAWKQYRKYIALESDPLG